MIDDLERIYAEVDAALLREDVSPRNRKAVTAVAARVVGDHMTKAGSGLFPPLAHPDRTVAEIVDDVCEYGVLGKLLADPRVEDVLVEGSTIRAMVGGRPIAPTEPTTEARNRHVITQLLLSSGVALDDSHPIVDGVQVLGGRGRLAAAIPPVSPVLSATIRLKRGTTPSLDDLVGWGMLSGAAAELLVLLLRSKLNFLISGEAGSGKTTLLASVLHEADPAHVLRIVEEYREIDFTHELGQSYQIAPKADDPECRSIAGLLRFVLRTNPGLVVVGEVRGPEAWDLARAASVGAGFAATIHAPHAAGGLEALVLLGRGHRDRPEPVDIRETFSDRIAVVVHCRRGVTPEGAYVHEVAEIRAVMPPIDPTRAFSSEPLFERVDGLGSPMRWTNLLPPPELVARLEANMPPGDSLRSLLGSA